MSVFFCFFNFQVQVNRGTVEEKSLFLTKAIRKCDPEPGKEKEKKKKKDNLF